MELVEIRCENCGKEIYVLSDYIRKEMFCTLRCMDLYIRALSSKSRSIH